MSNMKAVRIHTYGGIHELAYEDAPRPTPSTGEILIRVFASSVNPFDTAVRAGYMTSYFSYSLPLIIGTDVSGVVVEVGPDVQAFKPGDEVYGRAGVYRDGGNAEYVAIPAADAAHKPKTLNHTYSAAIPHVSLTAWQAIIVLADLQPGQTILIHGAAGGVGHIAVQLAKMLGAKVIGTASQNIDFVRELGVEQAVNYATTPFEKAVQGVDVVLDTIGGDTQERSWGVLKPGGILVSTVQQPSEETAAAHGVRWGFVYTTPPIGEVLEKVAALVDSGKIKPHISAILSLSEIQKAHTMIESRHTQGKIVLLVAQ